MPAAYFGDTAGQAFGYAQAYNENRARELQNAFQMMQRDRQVAAQRDYQNRALQYDMARAAQSDVLAERDYQARTQDVATARAFQEQYTGPEIASRTRLNISKASEPNTREFQQQERKLNDIWPVAQSGLLKQSDLLPTGAFGDIPEYHKVIAWRINEAVYQRNKSAYESAIRARDLYNSYGPEQKKQQSLAEDEIKIPEKIGGFWGFGKTLNPERTKAKEASRSQWNRVNSVKDFRETVGKNPRNYNIDLTDEGAQVSTAEPYDIYDVQRPGMPQSGTPMNLQSNRMNLANAYSWNPPQGYSPMGTNRNMPTVSPNVVMPPGSSNVMTNAPRVQTGFVRKGNNWFQVLEDGSMQFYGSQ